MAIRDRCFMWICISIKGSRNSCPNCIFVLLNSGTQDWNKGYFDNLFNFCGNDFSPLHAPAYQKRGCSECFSLFTMATQQASQPFILFLSSDSSWFVGSYFAGSFHIITC